MAKTDGTYYIPDEDGIKPQVDDGHVYRLDLHAQLVAGSGYAKLTVEGQSPLDDSWSDITSEWMGQGWFKARDGATEDYALLDGRLMLSAYPAVRAKIELDTSGANDADYSATWTRVDLR